MNPEEIASKKLCRDIINAKDFTAPARVLTPEERKQYVADASAVYNSSAFKDIIKHVQYEQMMFAITKSENEQQLMFARGIMSGADLIEERMAVLDAEHKQNQKDVTPADDSSLEPVINKPLNA